MMRLEARKIDDGTGPFRWRPVVLQGTQLALGSIYEQPDTLAEQDEQEIAAMLADVGHEVRRAA